MEFIWKSEPSHTAKINFFDNKRGKRNTTDKDAHHNPPSRAVARNNHPPSGVVYRRIHPPKGEVSSNDLQQTYECDMNVAEIPIASLNIR
eukprot:7845464-Karenia_brevis.AAC.1